MSERCCAKQVAEAIGMWSLHNGTSSAFCIELEDSENLKCLDLILSTLVVFRDAFSSEMVHSCFKCLEYSTSKRKFLEYLNPRTVFLADKNEHFDFMLICTYFSQILNYRARYRNCFHLARVACKVLTKILEDKFGKIFNTDSDWQSLISYCRSIHAAVFPSRENRPPGYEMDYRKLKLSIDSDGTAAFAKKAEVGEDQNKVIDLKVLEQRTDRDPNLLSEMFWLIPKSNHSRNLQYEEIDCEKSTYWKYHSLDSIIICKRITQDKTHLKDVCALIRKMNYIESKDFPSWYPVLLKEYSKSFSKYINKLADDKNEDIKFLEKDDVNHEKEMEKQVVLSYVEGEVLESTKMREFFAGIFCQMENVRLGTISGEQYQIRPEDLSDDQIRQFCLKEFVKEENKCEPCEGKMRAFGEHWLEIFHKEYSNADIVTNLVSMSVDQDIYKKLHSWKLG